MEKARTFGANAKKIHAHSGFLHRETRKITDFSEKMTLAGTFDRVCSEKLNEAENCLHNKMKKQVLVLG